MPDWVFVALLLAAEVATPLVLAVLIFVLARWSAGESKRKAD